LRVRLPVPGVSTAYGRVRKISVVYSKDERKKKLEKNWWIFELFGP
jgi:hypothetical protein